MSGVLRQTMGEEHLPMVPEIYDRLITFDNLMVESTYPKLP